MSDNRLPGRGPFLAPPPEVLRRLEMTREKMILEEEDTVGFPLMDLSGVDLGGEYLADGMLFQTDLFGARLDGAVVRGAFAGGVILREASCCGTDFYKAELEGADFTGALAHGIHFSKAHLTNARFDHGDFWHGDFSDSYCSGASFVGANLSLCNFRDASLDGCDLSGAQFGWADLTGVSLDSNTRLARAKGIEHAVSAGMVRFEGEKFEGDAAKELLIRLASQPDG